MSLLKICWLSSNILLIRLIGEWGKYYFEKLSNYIYFWTDQRKNRYDRMTYPASQLKKVTRNLTDFATGNLFQNDKCNFFKIRYLSNSLLSVLADRTTDYIKLICEIIYLWNSTSKNMEGLCRSVTIIRCWNRSS